MTRRSFLGQAPLFLFAMVLCWFVLPDVTSPHHGGNIEDDAVSPKSQLERIDFLGAALLGLSILALMIPIEIGGNSVPWTSPVIFALFAAGFVLLALFAATEAWWAKEPIFPLILLQQRDVVASYVITGCQIAAQIGVSIPTWSFV
jgi:hypothetical protein